MTRCTLSLLAVAVVLAACTPASHRLPPKPVPTGTETRIVEVDGHTLHVQTGGWHHREHGRPIVVFQSGMGTSLDTWRPIIGHVAEFAPVIAYDRSGLGRSPWDDQPPTPQHVNATLRRLLATLGAEPPYVLVGYSWGGGLIQHYAGTHPDEVAGLVFVDAPELTRWRQRESAIFEELGIGVEGMAAFHDAERKAVGSRSPAARAELEMILDIITREHPELERLSGPVVPTAVLIALRFEPWEGFESPVDLRHFMDIDRRLTIRQRTESIRGNPDATLVLATHAGHAVHADDPDLVVEAIRRVTFPDLTGRLTRAIAAEGTAAAVELYGRLRRSYPANRFDEDLLSRLGYSLLREQNAEAAIAIFELNVREYPDVANPHDGLGDGYAAAGRLEEALASYRRAVQLAEASGDPRLSTFRQNHERTEQRLREGR